MLSDLINRIKPSPTIAMSGKAKKLQQAGIEVVDFSVGEPDMQTPVHIADAAKLALDLGMTKYTIVDGTLAIKAAICNKFIRENNLTYDTNEISVSNGAKQVIFNALAASINPGDEVIIPSPSWVSYVDMVSIFGGVPVSPRTTAEEDYCISGEKLEKAITQKTKWIILNSPANPTGAVYSKQAWLEIAEVMRRYPHVHLLSDDIYEHIVFDDNKFYNILNLAPDLAERVLIVNGVSKSYCMTGFRIGYAASKNTKLIDAMRAIQSQSTSSPNSIAQHATVMALDSEKSIEHIANMRKIMQERRDLVYSKLSQIEGIVPFKAKGTFYIFSSIEKLIGKEIDGARISSSDDFCSILLDKFHVATVSGDGFGIPNHFRLSFACDFNSLDKGINIISNFVKDLK